MSKSYTSPSKWDMRKFRVRQKVKHLNYNVWRFTEKVCRKALFLGRDTEMDWIGKDGLVDGDLLSERISNSHIRYHGKPRREHYMDQTLRFVFLKWWEPIFTFKRWVRNKFEWYLFFKAREIHWKTHHYINRKGTDHIDGYFEYKVWGIRCGRTFDLCSLSCLKHDAKEWDTKTKKNKNVLGFHDLNKYGSWGFPTILVIKEKIMPKDIDKLLNRWYSEQVEYKYRHWTWKGDRPKITVADLLFMEDCCQTCHYGGAGKEDEHADWCKDKKE